jgi:mRNA-degrading endonuclease YafQ of YafQ-DinJ toxin-antitoxin module
MTFTLVTTRHFDRCARKFLRRHPDLKPALRETLGQLRQDPFHPTLRLHALSGELSGIHAASLTHSYRLTLTLQITEREIVLLDIGSHDEVYG